MAVLVELGQYRVFHRHLHYRSENAPLSQTTIQNTFACVSEDVIKTREITMSEIVKGFILIIFELLLETKLIRYSSSGISKMAMLN